jgi:hypothetical protein
MSMQCVQHSATHSITTPPPHTHSLSTHGDTLGGHASLAADRPREGGHANRRAEEVGRLEAAADGALGCHGVVARGLVDAELDAERARLAGANLQPRPRHRVALLLHDGRDSRLGRDLHALVAEAGGQRELEASVADRRGALVGHLDFEGGELAPSDRLAHANRGGEGRARLALGGAQKAGQEGRGGEEAEAAARHHLCSIGQCVRSCAR